MKLVGLTGNIGVGKSTVAAMIRDKGIPVIDADQLSREILQPGEAAHADVLAHFPGVARAGVIDRRALALRVGMDPAKRKLLESITHPEIQARMLERARALAADGHKLAFYEASLLVETGRHKDFDALVVVTAPREEQLARVIRRDGCSATEVKWRLDAQLAPEEKLKAATHVIDNRGDLAALQAQVDKLLAELAPA